MKLFAFNVCFNLPDDFTGDVNEALEEFIKYNRAHAPTIPEDTEMEIIGCTDTELAEERELYRKIMEANRLGTDQKSAYAYSLCELDDSDNIWKPILPSEPPIDEPT